MDNLYYISKDSFNTLLQSMSKEFDIFIPYYSNGLQHYKKYENNNDINSYKPDGYRTFEPLKGFYFRSREIVAEDFSDSIPIENKRPLCIVGAKACDLKGFFVQDYVFMNHDYTDPSYKTNRENNIIISSDCTESLDTCFCTAFGENPYPTKNYDLNLSPVEDGYIIEIGSTKGKNIVSSNNNLFNIPDKDIIEIRDKNRKYIIQQVKNNVKRYEVPDYTILNNSIQNNYESDIWKDEASTCVECGACNTICPTCHCFLLYDQKNNSKLARFRVWDSCLIKDFALVAAGVNPRPYLWMRLRNRFEKKFDFFPKVANFYACTGCGRCISACPGKIDIRRVLKRLVENV